MDPRDHTPEGRAAQGAYAQALSDQNAAMRNLDKSIRGDVKEAYNQYIGASSYDMNKTLAGFDPENGSTKEEMQLLIDNLNTAFNEVGTPAEPGTYYRGLSAKESTAIANLKEGDEFVCNTFVSTSESLKAIDAFGGSSSYNPVSVKQDIIVKDSFRPNRLLGNEYEYEHIFPSGTRFKVLQATTAKGDQRSSVHQILEVIG